MKLDLDGLAAASRNALMAEWRKVVGRCSLFLYARRALVA